MSRMISFQGEPGANSHIACAEAYPDLDPMPCPTFEDAFAAVQEGKAALAMIPIENSIAGRVADIHHLLPTSGLHIIGEHFLPIHFQLMALPGASLATIKDVYSHVHAIGQCRKIVRKLGLMALAVREAECVARVTLGTRDREAGGRVEAARDQHHSRPARDLPSSRRTGITHRPGSLPQRILCSWICSRTSNRSARIHSASSRAARKPSAAIARDWRAAGP